MKILSSVTKGGLTTYEDGLKFSDHRALFIDIKETDVFVDKGSDPTARENRGLRTKSKEQTKAYLEIVHSHFAEHNIYEKCMNLRESAPTMKVLLFKQEADRIDYQITHLVLNAEKKVSRKNFGYGWSPELASAGREATFWRNCLRYHKAGHNLASNIPLKQRQLYGIATPINPNTTFLRNKLEDAWFKLNLVQDNSRVLQKQYLDK